MDKENVDSNSNILRSRIYSSHKCTVRKSGLAIIADSYKSSDSDSPILTGTSLPEESESVIGPTPVTSPTCMSTAQPDETRTVSDVPQRYLWSGKTLSLIRHPVHASYNSSGAAIRSGEEDVVHGEDARPMKKANSSSGPDSVFSDSEMYNRMKERKLRADTYPKSAVEKLEIVKSWSRPTVRRRISTPVGEETAEEILEEDMKRIRTLLSRPEKNELNDSSDLPEFPKFTGDGSNQPNESGTALNPSVNTDDVDTEPYNNAVAASARASVTVVGGQSTNNRCEQSAPTEDATMPGPSASNLPYTFPKRRKIRHRPSRKLNKYIVDASDSEDAEFPSRKKSKSVIYTRGNIDDQRTALEFYAFWKDMSSQSDDEKRDPDYRVNRYYATRFRKRNTPNTSTSPTHCYSTLPPNCDNGAADDEMSDADSSSRLSVRQSSNISHDPMDTGVRDSAQSSDEQSSANVSVITLSSNASTYTGCSISKPIVLTSSNSSSNRSATSDES